MIKEKVSENPTAIPLLKWILFNALLCAVCLTHIYTVPGLFDNTKSFLNVTLHDSFEEEFNLDCHPEEPFCGAIWVKLVFFLGFAASQFSMGFFADRYGPYNLLKVNQYWR